MSSDLLAEFDSFYKAPQSKQTNATPASNDLAILSSTSQSRNLAQSGGFSQWQQQAPEPAEDAWNFQPSTQKPQTATVQDDIWGSFEEATPQSTPVTSAFPSIKPNYGGMSTSNASQKPGIVLRPTIDLFSGNMQEQSYPARNVAPSAAPIPARAPAPASKSMSIEQSSSGGDVLFDAEALSPEGEDEDDFGDFEGVSSPAPIPPAQSAQPVLPQSLNYLFSDTTIRPKNKPKDLLSTTLGGGNLPYPQAPKSPSFQERNPFSGMALSMKPTTTVKNDDKPKSASPVTAWPTYEPKKPEKYQDSPIPKDALEDDWGDFADLPPETPAETPAKPTSGIGADAWAWDAVDSSNARPVDPPVNTAPPTNIPPPSVLLTLFPPLFDLPQSSLFSAVANQPFSLKNRILSDPSTIDFLRAYILIGVVAARIIAGRKLRWKRDTLLSQAMKIGPAAVGGKGGMKLTGIDKAEVARENREAGEAIRVWKEQLGRLRSTIAVANTSMNDTSAHLSIPDISEAMHIKTQEGALTAPKPCIICGLKREERVDKVDVNVEDSFGEWWVEHWGHRACRNFWLEQESKLKHH